MKRLVASSDIPNKDLLKKAIEVYMNGNAVSIHRGSWRISDGGYNLLAQIYCDEIPAIDIVGSSWGNCRVEANQNRFAPLTDFVASILNSYDGVNASV